MVGSIQQTSSRLICALRAFLVSSLLPTHHSRTALQSGSIKWSRTQLEQCWCSQDSSSLWAEAVSYIVYTKNCSHHRAIDDVPERIWSGKAPGVVHLHPFGCRAWKYAAEPHQHAVKLAPCGLACISMGYSADHMAYCLWDPSTCKVELAHNVQFFKNVFPAAGDHSDAQELIFHVVSFPDKGS
jgi:hypothetical protein